LKEKGDAMLYRDIMGEVAKLKGFTDEEIEKYIAQLYTEINIDGRFVCVGRGLWGLREWYPTEQATDSAVAANVKDDYLDDELDDEIFDDEDEDLDHDDLGDIDDLDLPYDEDDAPYSELDDELVSEEEDEEDL
jgi:DNA-directed RNA polymerase subunit delta